MTFAERVPPLFTGLLFLTACGPGERTQPHLDWADYPLTFDGSFLDGAAGSASLELFGDGHAELELDAHIVARLGDGEEVILGPEDDWLAHGRLFLMPVESQDDRLRFAVAHDPASHPGPTLDTYMVSVDYVPVSGDLALADSGDVEARFSAPREGTPEDAEFPWVAPPEMLDEGIVGPVEVICLEGRTHPSCESAP